MEIDKNKAFKLTDAVFEMPSIKRILDDGKVTVEELHEQSEMTMKLFEELNATLTEEQSAKLTELIKETGVLFTVCLYHNLKSL